VNRTQKQSPPAKKPINNNSKEQNRKRPTVHEVVHNHTHHELNTQQNRYQNDPDNTQFNLVNKTNQSKYKSINNGTNWPVN